ncbi:MAG: type II secretion system protein [Planctomycetota bacterium]|jgi:prepilin-type N-terminal cleavage/methylation domain-containing protein/prepilin-type processing-associated H-X9-DG protein
MGNHEEGLIKHRAKGFTLIELLVVIAIIAILMGILMPALKKAKNQAQSSACQGNLKNFTLAVAMYAQDHDDLFCHPGSCYFSQLSSYPGEQGGRHKRWCNGDMYLRDHPEYASEFFTYLKEARALICPTFKGLAKSTRFHSDFADESDGVTNYMPWYNYSMNAYLGMKDGQWGVLKTLNVKSPAQIFSFADEGCLIKPGYFRQGLNDTALFPVWPTNEAPNWVARAGGSKWNVRPGPASEGGSGELTDVIAGFHNAPSGDPIGGKGNVAFVDGHVAPHPTADSFPLAWPY